jgi:hypothetical protein
MISQTPMLLPQTQTPTKKSRLNVEITSNSVTPHPLNAVEKDSLYGT